MLLYMQVSLFNYVLLTLWVSIQVFSFVGGKISKYVSWEFF